MESIARISSAVKLVFFNAWMESTICSGLLEPISTEVTLSSLSNQARAICASFCPLSSAS